MEKIIAVVSGKGGVGKTMLVSNLGLALAEFNKKTTVVDADLSTANLGLQLGLYQFPMGLQDALDGNVKASEAIYTHQSGLRVLPASISLSYLNKNPNPFRLKSILNDLDGTILIDSPPGLGREVFFVLKACTDVVVITNPEIPAVTDALKVIRVARELKKEPVGVIVNRARDSYELRAAEVEAMCEAPVIGTIPEDREIKRSLFEKMPLISRRPYSPASIAIRKIAANLIGEEYKPPRLLRLRNLISR
jgi:septum site-determining protein MinD